jgi:hypothetical protein
MLILGGRRLQILQLELHLLQKPDPSFAAPSKELAAHLLDGKPQMRDHRLGAGLPSARLDEVRLRLSQFHLACQNEALEHLDVVRQGVGGGHALRRADSHPFVSRRPAN